MKEKRKNILSNFFNQLNKEQQDLIRDYLQDKKLESLSKSFDLIIEGHKNENKEN
jgi:hypothetical protein